MLPHVGGPIIPAAPIAVLAEAKPAARLADYAFCMGPQDVLFEGAATVLVGGLPFCRVLDKSAHGGPVVQGAAMVLVGGPAFSLPSNIQVKGPPTYQNQVIRDLYFLSTTRTGREILNRLGSSGQPIEIVPESDPHNSFCSPANPSDAAAGTPTGSTISYNPAVGLQAYDSSNNTIDFPPQVVLAHEMVHALNNAEGNHSYGTDPSPPASEPGIAEEEARAIGTGSHSSDFPTENSLRQDLGMPRRDNHFGQNSSPTGDRRPGGY